MPRGKQRDNGRSVALGVAMGICIKTVAIPGDKIPPISDLITTRYRHTREIITNTKHTLAMDP